MPKLKINIYLATRDANLKTSWVNVNNPTCPYKNAAESSTDRLERARSDQVTERGHRYGFSALAASEERRSSRLSLSGLLRWQVWRKCFSCVETTPQNRKHGESERELAGATTLPPSVTYQGPKTHGLVVERDHRHDKRVTKGSCDIMVAITRNIYKCCCCFIRETLMCCSSSEF